MSKEALDILKDYVERSTHWCEGGADRHAAKQALDELTEDIRDMREGLAQWRHLALVNGRHTEASGATARVAIGHLQALLNKPRTYAEQRQADTAARDWLLSIGSEPM